MQKVYVVFVVIVLVVACSETPINSTQNEQHKVEHEVINGIERSELALLMRKMYDDLKLVRDSLKRGLDVQTDFIEEFKGIHTAHATEPEKIDDAYQGMATAFLEAYASYENSEEGKQRAFNIMLDGCLACHQQKCPGPIKAINKLKLKPGE